MNIWFLAIFLGAVFFVLGVMLYTGLSFAPWVPLHRKDIKRVLRLAGLRKGEVFVELGSGSGGMTMAAAAVPGVQSRGIELSPFLFAWTWLRAKLNRKSKPEFLLGNLFSHSLADADVIYFFGMPTATERLVKKFRAECKPGTRVISYVFSIPQLTPTHVDKPSEKDATIYLYTL